MSAGEHPKPLLALLLIVQSSARQCARYQKCVKKCVKTEKSRLDFYESKRLFLELVTGVELASQKRRLQQYQGKLERLQQQMSILSSALGEYQQSMQVFQAQAAQQGQVTMQSVDSCIQCVELYMQYC